MPGNEGQKKITTYFHLTSAMCGAQYYTLSKRRPNKR